MLMIDGKRLDDPHRCYVIAEASGNHAQDFARAEALVYAAAEAQADNCVVGSPEQAYWLSKASAFANRSPFLKDQSIRKPASASATARWILPAGIDILLSCASRARNIFSHKI